MSLPVASIGLVGGGSKAWEVSYDDAKTEITIGYGTMFYNGKFFTTNDIEEGSIETGVGTDQKIAGINPKGFFVYLYILNPLSLPTETNEDLKMKIGIATSATHPDGNNSINTNAPLIEWIPLAFCDNDGAITDMRPTFWVSNFSFLA